MPERLCRIHTEGNGLATMTIAGSEAATARQLLEAVRRQAASLSSHEEIRGIIVCGQGESFCRCGAEERFDSPYGAAELAALGQQVMFSMEKIGKPCIAAISGECSGIGLELALACDFIV